MKLDLQPHELIALNDVLTVRLEQLISMYGANNLVTTPGDNRRALIALQEKIRSAVIIGMKQDDKFLDWEAKQKKLLLEMQDIAKDDGDYSMLKNSVTIMADDDDEIKKIAQYPKKSGRRPHPPYMPKFDNKKIAYKQR